MKTFKMTAPLVLALVAALALSITTATAMGASHKKHAGKLTIGFVTHAVGDPFIKQILQAAKDAGKDLGVNVKTTGTPGFDPAAQLKMVQDLFASGADGVATSITGDSMATGLNALVARASRSSSSTSTQPRINAPYVGERSVDDWAILGKTVRTKMGGASATARPSSSAPAPPASRRSSTASTASRRASAPGSRSRAPTT